MLLTWIGHSCFKLENNGYTVIFDPYKDGSVPGLAPVRERADMVICSHEHGDHSGRECVKIKLRKSLPYKITKIETFHDDAEGTKRGNNTITVLDDGDLRIAHFGDLGCELTGGQLAELKDLDYALIPVGGYYTIDAKQAAELVRRIGPAHVIPMHYRDDDKCFGYDVLSLVDDFIREMGSADVKENSFLDLEDGSAAQVIVLDPLNAEERC